MMILLLLGLLPLCIGGLLVPIQRHVGEKATVIPDEAYHAMQRTLLATLDGVSQKSFVDNWLQLLSENVTVCYPFAGLVDASCLHGLAQVKKTWTPQAGMNGTVAIDQNSYWISSSAANLKLGVWSYTTASSYNTKGVSCVVMFQGIVMYSLDPSNPSQILSWLEAPDSARLNNTYPCV